MANSTFERNSDQIAPSFPGLSEEDRQALENRLVPGLKPDHYWHTMQAIRYAAGYLVDIESIKPEYVHRALAIEYGQKILKETNYGEDI